MAYKDPEKRRQARRLWRLEYAPNNIEKIKNQQLLWNYGITFEEYEVLTEKQSGVCALCHEPETMRGRNGNIKSLSVDHDHITGRVRALLCHLCNVSLGHLRDRPELALRAYGYLMFWKEQHENMTREIVETQPNLIDSQNLLTS